jgi:hypothetical protein
MAARLPRFANGSRVVVAVVATRRSATTNRTRHLIDSAVENVAIEDRDRPAAHVIDGAEEQQSSATGSGGHGLECYTPCETSAQRLQGD